MITSNNKFSNKSVFNNNNNERIDNIKDNFTIISKINNSSEIKSFLFYYGHKKENNTIRKIFNSNSKLYTIEIKNFKYIKQSNMSGVGLNKLDYILFNNGDFYSLDSSNFDIVKELHFVCNISSIIEVNNVIQIEPYYANSYFPSMNEIIGFFILDTNYKLFRLENERIFLVSFNVNVFEIYNKIHNDHDTFFLSYIEDNNKIVAYEYNICTLHDGDDYCKERTRFTKTFNDNIIDINLHQSEITCLNSNGKINKVTLHHKRGFNFQNMNEAFFAYFEYFENKYYN